jgi:DNA-binding response OmpR family regulator
MAAGAKTVFVINDDERFLDMVKVVLENEGYRVVTHQGALGAYWLVEATRPDLVIVGMRSEGLCDWHALAMLKLDRETAPIPVLACSPRGARSRHLRGALRDQGNDVLATPIDLDELLGQIERLTSGGRTN